MFVYSQRFRTVDAGCKFGLYVGASLRGAVMGLFRDSRDRRDLSLKVCWTLAVWLMTQQLRCDVNEADEAEQRRLERHPELGHARAVLAGARLASDGEHLANGLPVAHAWPVVGLRMATAAAAMPFATCVALAPGAHTSAAVAQMPLATCEVVAPSGGVVVDAGHVRNVYAMSLDPVQQAESMATAWFRVPRSRRARGWIGACPTGDAPFVVTRLRCRNKWTCAATATAPGGNLAIVMLSRARAHAAWRREE